LPTPTLIQYYKHFKSVLGVLAGVFTAIGPAVSFIASGAVEAYSFPPLGNVAMIGRIGILMLGGITTLIAFTSNPPANAFRRFLIIGICAFVSLICYFTAFAHFVRRVDIPATDTSVFVTVGYTKTEFAKNTFTNSETDTEMLMNRGIDDEQIEKLWTPRSVDVSRIALFFFYSGFILPFVLIFSLGVRYQI
jgi:hypothetical protein